MSSPRKTRTTPSKLHLFARTFCPRVKKQVTTNEGDICEPWHQIGQCERNVLRNGQKNFPPGQPSMPIRRRKWFICAIICEASLLPAVINRWDEKGGSEEKHGEQCQPAAGSETDRQVARFLDRGIHTRHRTRISPYPKIDNKLELHRFAQCHVSILCNRWLFA
jgi:hypothetical protein